MSLLRRTRAQTIAIADIRPGTAGVAVATVGSGAASVKASARTALSLDTLTAEQAVGGIPAMIQESGAKALGSYRASDERTAVETVYMIAHAPWMRSETVSTAARFADDTVVEESLMRSLARDAFARRQVIDPKNLAEAAIVHTMLNGYPAEQAVGARVRTVEAFSILSDIDPTVRSRAEAAVAQLFPAAEVRWRSAMRSALSVARAIRGGDDFVLVDMGLESTHILSVRDCVLTGQRTIPHGVATILSRLAPGRLPEETLGYMRMVSREACEGTQCDAVQAAAVAAEPELARLFGEAFAQIASEEHMPNDLLLLTNEALTGWLSRFFERIDFSQFTTTSRPFSVIELCPDDLLPLVAAAEEMPPDHFLLIGAALAELETREA